jgi:hypothetical protein|tara:strand:+ start:25784 stop:26392 length:609 start_codon:yes stop_codon:yes gene_type:complete
MKREVIVFLISSLLLLSCNNLSFSSKEELLHHIKNTDNGYYAEKTVNGIDFSLLYRPTDLVVSQFVDSDSIVTIGIRDSLRKHYGDYLYFNLSLSHNGRDILTSLPRSKNEYGSLVNTFSFGMRDIVHLYTEDNDTLPLYDFNFPRMYGLSKATSVLLVYPKPKKMENNYFFLSIEDFGLQTGEVRFKLKKDKIENQPTLNF